MDESTNLSRDGLDDKVNSVFAGKVVRKDLVRKVKVGANVPVFVLEYLLGKYCASSDEVAIQMGFRWSTTRWLTTTSGPMNQCEHRVASRNRAATHS